MQTDKILQLLEPFTYKTLMGTEGEVILFCPFCADRENHSHGHLGLHVGGEKHLSWHCVYCGRGSDKIEVLLKAYSINLSYLDKVSLQFSGSANLNVIPSKTDANPALKAFSEESQNIQEGSWAYDYLAKRGINKPDIARYWRTWEKKPGYVFWFTPDEHGNPLFFSGRAYLKGLEPKYYHLSTSPPTVLFHAKTFVPTPSFSGRSLVFLVEGVFDAFFAPGPAIPLFAKKLSNKMQTGIKRLILMNNLSPVAALDREEVDDNIELATLLHSWCEETYLFKMAPCKDFGENRMAGLSNVEINKRLVPFSPHIGNLLALQMQS